MLLFQIGIARGSMLDGVVITGGNADATTNLNSIGAGVYISFRLDDQQRFSPSAIRNCLFERN